MTADDLSTSKKLKKYVRSQIESIGICHSIREQNPSKFLFFIELFQRHPEKEKKGVDKIIDIQIKQHQKGDYQLHIVKVDGTSNTISWNACVRKKADTHGRKLRTAFRAQIDDQIVAFRTANRYQTCLFCKSETDLTVDHVHPFAKLKKDFSNLYPCTPTEFSKNHIQQHCFRKEDSIYANAWSTYHRSHAILRILCHPCNISRNKCNDSASVSTSASVSSRSTSVSTSTSVSVSSRSASISSRSISISSRSSSSQDNKSI